MAMMTSHLMPKRVELLRQLIPNANKIGLIVNPTNPNTEAQVADITTIQALLGRPPEVVAGLPERLQELLGYNIYPPFLGYVDGRHPRRSLPLLDRP